MQLLSRDWGGSGGEAGGEGFGGGVLDVMHGRSRMTVDPRIPAQPERSTSGFHRYISSSRATYSGFIILALDIRVGKPGPIRGWPCVCSRCSRFVGSTSPYFCFPVLSSVCCCCRLLERSVWVRAWVGRRRITGRRARRSSRCLFCTTTAAAGNHSGSLHLLPGYIFFFLARDLGEHGAVVRGGG